MNWPLLIAASVLVLGVALFTAWVAWSYRDILFDKKDNLSHKE